MSAPAELNIDRIAQLARLALTPEEKVKFAAQLGDDLLPPREPGELQAGVDFTDIAVRARGTGLEPFLRVPAVRTKFRLPEVQRDRRVASVQVESFDFRFNKAFRSAQDDNFHARSQS